MKQRRFGFLLVMAVALVPLTAYFLGCGGGDGGGSSGNGPSASRFVAVANTNAGNLSVYAIQSNGTLRFLDNVSQSVGTEPSMILVHPNEKFVYVVNHDGVISVFSYSSDNGALVETESSPYHTPDNAPATTEPINMAITPDGKFLYVTDQGDSQVHIYGVDNTTGNLAFSESVAVNDIHSVSMHPSGNFVSFGTESDEIWTYAINTDNGSLTPTPGTPYVSGLGATWVWLDTTPDGVSLIGAGQDVGGILSIDNVTGDLTEEATEDMAGWFPKSLVIAPTLPFMYSANWDNNSIGAYESNDTGGFDNVAGMPFAAGVTPKSVTITGDSKYLYVANYGFTSGVTHNAGEGSVMAYSVNRTTGRLSLIGTYPLGFGAGPKHLTVLP